MEADVIERSARLPFITLRNTTAIVVAASVLFVIPWRVTAQSGPAKSILKNAGFESGEESPADWTKGASIPGVVYRWDRGAAHGGKASLLLKKTANRFFPIAQWLQTVPNTSTARKLKVGAWVKADKARKAILDVRFALAGGGSKHEWAAYIGQKKESDPPATHGWKRYGSTIRIPDEATEITVALQLYGPGAVWFDDVTAELVDLPAIPVEKTADTKVESTNDVPVRTIPSLAANPGLESGEGNAPTGWRQGVDIAGVEYLWDRETGHASKSSASIRKTANRFFPIAQWVQAISHDGSSKRFRVSAWIKASRVNKAVLDIQFSPDGVDWGHKWAAYIGARESNDPPADHDWRKYEGTVDIPAGTQKILIGLQMYGPGQVWFDDISVEYVN